MKNFHWPTFPVPVSPAANLAINAASFDETVPLPLESAANLWFWLTNGTAAETPCATLAASFDVIAVFEPPGLVGLIVYEPDPNPVSVYCPAVAPGAAVVVSTFGNPVPVTVTFEIYFGGAAALPYKKSF